MTHWHVVRCTECGGPLAYVPCNPGAERAPASVAARPSIELCYLCALSFAQVATMTNATNCPDTTALHARETNQVRYDHSRTMRWRAGVQFRYQKWQTEQDQEQIRVLDLPDNEKADATRIDGAAFDVDEIF